MNIPKKDQTRMGDIQKTIKKHKNISKNQPKAKKLTSKYGGRTEKQIQYNFLKFYLFSYTSKFNCWKEAKFLKLYWDNIDYINKFQGNTTISMYGKRYIKELLEIIRTRENKNFVFEKKSFSEPLFKTKKRRSSPKLSGSTELCIFECYSENN